MQTIDQRLTNTSYRSLILLALVLQSLLSCSKKEIVTFSEDDVNYLIRTDNPNDLVDHALYNFYQETGIAGFYNDTIHVQRISSPEEATERFKYVRLAFLYNYKYTPLIGFSYLKEKENIPSFLEFFKSEVLPSLPSSKIIPSLFLIDSFSMLENPVARKMEEGFMATFGFNTVGVVVKDVAGMSIEKQKMYKASLLGGITENILSRKYALLMEADFYAPTITQVRTYSATLNYAFIPLYLFIPSVPVPERLGFLHYPLTLYQNVLRETMPNRTIDLRAYLTAVFFYTEQEFVEKYSSYPLVIQKFKVVAKLLSENNFKLP